jgi:hypothetical protein
MPGKSLAFISLITCVFVMISGFRFKESGFESLSFADGSDDQTALRDTRWMELARNSLATKAYEEASSIYGCSGECLNERFGFTNAMLMSVTSDEQCLYPSFERVEHQIGCLSYLRALQTEVQELRQWVDTPSSTFICIDEEVLIQQVTELHEQANKKSRGV